MGPRSWAEEDITVKRRRHTPEQIVRKLREVERLLGAGQTIAEAAKQVEISEQTYHRWRNQYGGMKADDARRLRELERENARLKRIVADKELEIDALRTELHAFSRGHSRWGYRRAWATLREEGWGVNRKRVQRLWREEGLRVPLKRRKRQRLGDSAQPARRLRAERPNHVWALDFQFDQTADGRVLEAAQHRRRAHAGGAGDRGRQAHQRRRHGLHARPDRRLARDGARLHPLRQRARAHGQRAARLVPVLRHGQQLHRARRTVGEPVRGVVQRPVRDEFLAVEQFDSLLEAQVLIEDWRIEYNTKRPHSSLGWLAPAAYAERWEAQQHAGL